MAMSSKRRRTDLSKIGGTEVISGRYNSKASLVAAVDTLPVSRVVFIHTIRSAQPGDCTDNICLFGHKSTHILQRVRILGLVVKVLEDAFYLDDGTGVLRIMQNTSDGNLQFACGQLVEVV